MFEVKTNKNDSGKVVSLSIKVDGERYFIVTNKLTGYRGFIIEGNPLLRPPGSRPTNKGHINMLFENSPEMTIVVEPEEFDALITEIEKAVSQSFDFKE